MGHLVGPRQLAEAELLLQVMARRQDLRRSEDAMAPLIERLERMAERMAHVAGEPAPPASQCSRAQLMIRKALLFGDVGSTAFRLVLCRELRLFVDEKRQVLSA